ncbi:MAG: prolyl-tRNA synthetase associated domain-containing protein [Salinivirgaceae bacterium]|jgi:Ala-tRNA(Pro) deacylase|nr:prolyl-tRNA synthetase associated domain-containing protein [Salinivirgaceae bacterium]
MIGQSELYAKLEELQIQFDYYEHPPLHTIEEAIEHKWWMDATFCKNLFFRNHKGKKHYLVILHHAYQLDIHDLEKRLKQGKLSFASEWRMEKYLGLKPGSVTPFGLINDTENHVHIFLDENLKKAGKLSFHPCDNRATLNIKQSDFIKFMNDTGNSYEFLTLYE